LTKEEKIPISTIGFWFKELHQQGLEQSEKVD
jgi:hypothetical protein